MTTSDVVSNVRALRNAAQLSQGELAERVGVSRQALSAIEASRQVPSTGLALELARALRCSVDDLFHLARGPVVTARMASSVGDGARRVVVGRVDGELVAHPAPDETESADGLLATRATCRVSGDIELLTDAGDIDGNALVAGCAPLLGLLSDRLGRRFRDARATWLPASSAGALTLLEEGSVHIGGVHLAEATDSSAHARVAREALPGQAAQLINLARWRQGLVVAAGNPLDIRGPEDLARPDLRFAFRAAGSGAHAVLLRALAAAGLDALPPCALQLPAANHDEVGQLVRWGLADVGVAIEAAALARGLTFIPLSEERFDLIVPDHRLDEAPVAKLLDLIDRPTFRAEAAGLRGYDLSSAGHALSVPAS